MTFIENWGTTKIQKFFFDIDSTYHYNSIKELFNSDKLWLYTFLAFFVGFIVTIPIIYIEYNNKYAIPNYEESFNEWLKQVDNEMIMSIVEKTSLLIEDTELRRKMWINWRREFEEWKFSLLHKNKRLEKILNY